MNRLFALLVVFCSVLSFGQSKEPSTELQLKFLKAQRQIDSVTQKQQDVTNRYQALLAKFNQSADVQALQKESTANQDKINSLRGELQSLRDQAYKDAGFTPKDHDFDEETLTFSPKTEPAPPPISPAKK